MCDTTSSTAASCTCGTCPVHQGSFVMGPATTQDAGAFGVAGHVDVTVDGAITEMGLVSVSVVPPTRPSEPAYKSRDGIWRCGQPCGGIFCDAVCYRPVEVDHKEHDCADRVRAKVTRGLFARKEVCRDAC